MSKRRTDPDPLDPAGAEPEPSARYLRPSRSARKRDAEAAQKLGVHLIGLRPSVLLALPLPETLLEAIQQARRMKYGPALARQRQYIGRLMREIDLLPIQQALEKRP